MNSEIKLGGLNPFSPRALMLSGASLLCLALAGPPGYAQDFTEAPTAAPTAPPAGRHDRDRTGDGAAEVAALPTLDLPLDAAGAAAGQDLEAKAAFRRSSGRTSCSRTRMAGSATTTSPARRSPPTTRSSRIGRWATAMDAPASPATIPPSGMGLALTNIQARFRTNLNDPLFAPVDGANCPSAVPAQYTSGSLAGGIRGKGNAIAQGRLLADPDQGPDPDPDQGAGECGVSRSRSSATRPAATPSPTFNKDPVTGERILSMYRRPIFSASLRFKVPRRQRRTVRRPTSCGTVASPACARRRSRRPSATPRRRCLATDAQIDQIVDFETKFFSAQLIDRWRGRLDANAARRAGPSLRPVDHAAAGFPHRHRPVRRVRRIGRTSPGSPGRRQASIARGQAIFNTKTFTHGQCRRLQRLRVHDPRRADHRARHQRAVHLPWLPRLPACRQRAGLPAAARHRHGRPGASPAASTAPRPTPTRPGGVGPAPAKRPADLQDHLHRRAASVLRHGDHHQRSRHGADHRQVQGHRQEDRARAARAGLPRTVLQRRLGQRISRRWSTSTTSGSTSA